MPVYERRKTVAKLDPRLPRHYAKTMTDYPRLNRAMEALGTVLRREGPLDAKTAHLVQLAAAAAIRSEGSVHSHARRAMEAGATFREIEHTLILLVSTIGFPTVAAALCWVRDIQGRRPRRKQRTG
jgi:4-carboxymuconolactone decarboxylase